MATAKRKGLLGVLLGLALVLGIGLLPGTAKAAYADDFATTRLDVPDNWKDDPSQINPNVDLPGFSAITQDAAESWTGAPASGSARLIYNVEGGSCYFARFINGKYGYPSSFSLKKDFYELSQDASIYYTSAIEYPLWVGGTRVTSANAANITSGETVTASYDDETKTLTLDGYSYEGEGYPVAGNGNAAIYAGQDLTVQFNGANEVACAPGDGKSGSGVNVAGNLTIIGNDSSSLNATGSGCGVISQAGSVAIYGGVVNATGGSSWGIGSVDYDVTIAGGSVTAVGNNWGIAAGGSVAVNGGEVTASGSTQGIRGTVKNAVAGTGWTDVKGTEGMATIPVSTEGQSLEEYKKVQFPKVAATVTTKPAARTLAYNGKAQELVTAGKASGGMMQYTLGKDAKTAPTSGWSTSVPTGTEAGTYYVWYMAKGDAGHSDSAPACVDAAIAPAAPQNDLQAAGAVPYLNAATVTAADVQAIAATGATTITLGPKVKKIEPGAFAGTGIKTVIVKTKKLKKKTVKDAFKGSSVKTVKVQVKDKKSLKGLNGKAKKKAKKANDKAKAYNKKIAAKYKKFMTKKVVGKKVKVKA